MGDIGFKINGKTLENLRLYSLRSSKLSEMRLLELCDIASSLADLSADMIESGLPLYELLSVLGEELEQFQFFVHAVTSFRFCQASQRHSFANSKPPMRSSSSTDSQSDAWRSSSLRSERSFSQKASMP